MIIIGVILSPFYTQFFLSREILRFAILSVSNFPCGLNFQNWLHISLKVFIIFVVVNLKFKEKGGIKLGATCVRYREIS